MPRGKPIGPQDADQALRLVAEDKTLYEIATIIGVSYSGLHRALTETWPDEYAEARETAKQLRAYRKARRAKDAWDANDRLVAKQDHPQHFPAVKLAIEKNDPDAAAKVDVNVNGHVQVAHEARLTLAHVVGLAERLGLGGSARDELPAARPVLPEPEDG